MLEGLAKLEGGENTAAGGSSSPAEGASSSSSSSDNNDSINNSVDGNRRLPPNIHHRVLYSEHGRKLVTLCRQIRADAIAAGEDKPPPRTLVFVKDARRGKLSRVLYVKRYGARTRSSRSSRKDEKRSKWWKISIKVKHRLWYARRRPVVV